jgi:hypothetical protein
MLGTLVNGSAKAIGERGSWFAKVNGERPCVHQHWLRGTTHLDPNYDPDDPKFVELVTEISRLKRVILTRDNVFESPKKSGIGFERTGYIAVFDVSDVTADSDGLRFDLVNRVCEVR